MRGIDGVGGVMELGRQGAAQWGLEYTIGRLRDWSL